ncbi:hypothetical protein CORC01_02803 [Colletotrichum orchidophilum]|uniref:Uncharacterized protein n=1 Tax=Colletotrichum orchidophilum TaxID=1209926 RepID=A0A1G4BKR2_9PEZI|nr:uncharacterized protein CORC01_02803 [Colletotrichum orchidophilum]OHF01925.1 hypothetical protein CORC01_02803 [Colletotrichum orchidophilum]
MFGQRYSHPSESGLDPGPEEALRGRLSRPVSAEAFPHFISRERRGSTELDQGHETPVSHESPGGAMRPAMARREHFQPKCSLTEIEGNPFVTGLPDDQTSKVRSKSGTPAVNISINRKPVSTSTFSLDSEGYQRLVRDNSSYEKASKTECEPSTVKPLWRIWAWEVFCIFLSVSSFFLIVAVLCSYDQQPLPDWPLNITLNTFLAFFTTLAKAAFMLPVSVAISQSQWSWFLKDRPLHDLHLFDQASRGPWGSVMLLKRIRYTHFVSLGAVLMVVSALTSPITQLAINYPVRDSVALREEAKAPAVRNMTSDDDRMNAGSRRALVLATLSDSTGFLEPIAPTGAFCSTGNCTFERYQSLGICVKTANITSHLRVEEFDSPDMIDTLVLGFPKPDAKVWRASLPSGLEMAHQTPLAAMVDMLNGSETFAFQDDEDLKQTRISSFTVVYTNPTSLNETWWNGLSDAAAAPFASEVIGAIYDFRHEAMEFLYHLCVQTYETKIFMGVETTTLVETSAVPVEQEKPFFLDMQCRPLLGQASRTCNQSIDRWQETLHLKDPRFLTDLNVNSTVEEEQFSASYFSLERISTIMKTDLMGYASASYVTEEYQDTAVFFRGQDFIKTLFESVIFELNNIANSTLRQTCLKNIHTNIAISLSTIMRVNQPRSYAVNSFNITGEALTQVSYVYITWGWISMLAVEIGIALLFLALTVFSQSNLNRSHASSREEHYAFREAKNSSLATLVALDEASRNRAGGGLRSLDELENAAKVLRVRFEGRQMVTSDDSVVKASQVGDSGTGYN